MVTQCWGSKSKLGPDMWAFSVYRWYLKLRRIDKAEKRTRTGSWDTWTAVW